MVCLSGGKNYLQSPYLLHVQPYLELCYNWHKANWQNWLSKERSQTYALVTGGVLATNPDLILETKENCCC